MTEIPEWVTDELENPAAMGEGRNDQMIRVGPALIRAGHTAETLAELFCNLYGDLDVPQEREVHAVVRNCVKYAAKEDAGILKGEWIERRKLLNNVARTYREQLPSILERYRWPLAEIRMQRPGRMDNEILYFLSSLFNHSDIVWLGQVWETGERTRYGRTVNYARRFKPVAEWISFLNGSSTAPGEFVSHCTFKPGTFSRCNESVAEHKFMVVESDQLGVDEVGAVFNYLNVMQPLKLRAIVTTGGKSLHGWFEWPEGANEDTMEEWAAVIEGLRCDPSTLRPSQPVRLPGVIRKDTGRPQELIWLS